jgi:phage terminase large subunit-like protein
MTTPTLTRSRLSERERALGDRAVSFFCRRLYLSKGRLVPFVPTQDQAAFLREVFGTLNADGRRRYRTVYREVPKKNSKTTDTAGCLLKCLFDEEVYGGEVYSAAATRDQAGQTYRKMAMSVRRSPALYPKFRGKPVKLYDRDKRIYVAALEAFYQALSSDANYEDGIEASAAGVDELHRHKSRDLLDVVQEGMGAREQPLLFINTTAGAHQIGPAWDMHEYALDVMANPDHDPTFLAQIYYSPDGEDWEDEENWYRCNPMLQAGVLDIEDFRRAHRQAKRIPSAKRAFLRLRLNRWVATDESWLDPLEWDACGAEVAPLNPLKEWAGRECYGGLDLSSTSDFTALAWLFPRDDGGYDLWAQLFYPRLALADRRERREDIEEWARAGYVAFAGESSIDYSFVAQAVRRGCEAFDVVELGYDPWHAPNVINQESLSDVPVTMTKVSQYASVMNAPCRMTETLISERGLHHYGNPVLRWMAKNVIPEVNAYEAMRPSKAKSKDKIDGITATLIALERAMAPREEKGFAGVVVV